MKLHILIQVKIVTRFSFSEVSMKLHILIQVKIVTIYGGWSPPSGRATEIQDLFEPRWFGFVNTCYDFTPQLWQPIPHVRHPRYTAIHLHL